MIDRHLPILTSATTHLGDFWPLPPEDLSTIKGVIFRVLLEEETGRYEGNGISPVITG